MVLNFSRNLLVFRTLSEKISDFRQKLSAGMSKLFSICLNEHFGLSKFFQTNISLRIGKKKSTNGGNDFPFVTENNKDDVKFERATVQAFQ